MHLTAAAHIDFLVKLTYEDCVYYNQQKNLFQVSVGKDHPEAGYISSNELRDYMGTEACDAMFRKKMLLNREDTENIVSNGVWANFQPKFDITLQLYNYYPFFERIVRHILETHVE